MASSLFRKFVAESSKEKTDEVDPSLFNRRKEPSITQFIVDGLKVIESLPYIKFVDWKEIKDSSKINIKLNRRHLKDRKIQKQKEITKIVPIRDTAQEMLQMTFRIDYDGESRYIKKNLLIPSYIDDYHLLINGKEILPQKQIVDTSTYNRKKSVMLKTTLTPIDIYKKEVKDLFETTKGKVFKIETFIINLFTKEINPLYYYAAKFGITKTINYFSMSDIIDITEVEHDTSINYYFRINNNLFVEVDKRFFKKSDFVKSFTYMVYDLFPARSKSEIVDDVEYWLIRLGSIYTSNTKNQLNKGQNVLISFGRTLDDITANMLRLDKKHLKSTYSLIRWELQNFNGLRKKDNHDLANKRLRCNEVIAFYFIQSMSQRINNLLNKKKLSIEDIEKIFNWNPNELLRLMLSSKNTLLKYDPDINNFQLLNALRCSFLGPQGITGGKNISDSFRDIYPSHLGRIDLNAVSHGGNSCLTGFLVPTCEIYKNGFFSKESIDPDTFSSRIKRLKKSLKDKKIDERKEEINIEKHKYICRREGYLYEKSIPRDKNGKIIISKRTKLLKNLDTGEIIIFPRHNKDIEFVRSYRDENGILRDENGRIIISKRHKLKVDENNNYIISKRKTNNGYTIIDGRILLHRIKG